MKCIYVNDSESPFTKLILSGRKNIETRHCACLHDMLFEHVVGIIRTGSGQSMLVGDCRITEELKWHDTPPLHVPTCRTCLKKDSKFRNNKVWYRLENVKEYAEPIPVKELIVERHGYHWCEVKSLLIDIEYKEDIA